MESVYVKEALSLLDRVHLFAIQNEGDGSLQHAIEGVINIFEGTTIRLKKQTSVLLFFSSLSFFATCLCCTGVQESKVFYSKYSLFPNPFCQKMSAYLDRAKKKVKSLKIENFDQTSEKRTPQNSGKF